ncbi:hypothetical protein DL769_006084 [Monosporascus sp. CRB-8-3]|nr:hypothetical protein DL769_006084 [Monosporascus sp. CRB-8-3]
MAPPPDDIIEWQVSTIRDSPPDIAASPFVSGTYEETDAAWDHLLRFHNLRIWEDEMKAMNISSIAFNHGGGYHGMMGVFHELHCLRRLREAIHHDHYYRDFSEGKKKFLVGHSAHCIDILRTAAMCRADTMIFPYHWVDFTRVPAPTWVQKHECVNWDRLEAWLETRKVDIRAPNMMVHPKYGPAYPGGEHIDEPDGPQVLPLDPE